jgi:hypothetical protein
MSELLVPFGAASEGVEQPADVVETSPRTPVLITEQQVLFATAAAVPLPAKSSRRWTAAVRAIGASLIAAFATSSNEARPKRRQYPPRTDFLGDSRLSREMMRL